MTFTVWIGSEEPQTVAAEDAKVGPAGDLVLLNAFDKAIVVLARGEWRGCVANNKDDGPFEELHLVNNTAYLS
ncbi:MAG: hypothetical protein KGL39_56080 [Patescibacteria group bacterium]|nr:hypothetical protein [Patescibacteria group bacterium]